MLYPNFVGGYNHSPMVALGQKIQKKTRSFLEKPTRSKQPVTEQTCPSPSPSKKVLGDLQAGKEQSDANDQFLEETGPPGS